MEDSPKIFFIPGMKGCGERGRERERREREREKERERERERENALQTEMTQTRCSLLLDP